MSWTERYVRSDAPGGGDGTTDSNSGANASWTLTEALTNEAAGMRLNVKAGTYASTTTSRSFAAVGTTTSPIWWRGFKTTAGDQDSNNVAVAGTDIPTLTSTTGQFTASGAYHIFSNLDFNGATTTSNGLLVSNAAGITFYACRFTNTAANSASRALTLGGSSSGASCIRCAFSATSTATTMVSSAINNSFLGCTFTGGNIQLTLSGGSQKVGYCVFDSPAGDAISSSVNPTIFHCSFYAPGGNGINITTAGDMYVLNCYFENVNQAAKAAINNTSGTNTAQVRCIGNGYYNCTANTSGLGDMPLIFDVGTLASAAFSAPGSHNFAVDTVAKALGFPGLFENTSVYQGYLDLGAVQRQEPAGGGTNVFSGEF